MESLKEVRDPVYRGLAHVVVSTEGVDVDGAAERVAAAVNKVVGDQGGVTRLSIRAAAGEYQVLLGRGLLERAAELLRDAGLSGRVRLIADATVYGTHGPGLEAALRKGGYQVASYQVAPGEGSKSLETAARLQRLAGGDRNRAEGRSAGFRRWCRGGPGRVRGRHLPSRPAARPAAHQPIGAGGFLGGWQGGCQPPQRQEPDRRLLIRVW